MAAGMVLAAFLIGLLVGLVIWQLGTRAARKQNEELRVQLAGLAAQREADAEKVRWGEQAEQRMRDAFAALASHALQQNSQMLSNQAQSDLKNVVAPLKENLTALSEHVRQLEQDRRGAYDALREQLKTLGETHSRLQATTITLAQALKSPTVRGRWGELQLRRVVELAGMTSHISFEEQAVSEEGRPDMIVYLPNRGVLPIDSKVPLEAYLAAMETDDVETRRGRLAQHARALRDRVRELGQKKYWDQFPISPDFVVMFVPNEACLGAAFENDPSLLEFAIQNRVLIGSPINLVALLRVVAYGWQQHEITDNARRIAQEGKDLYNRIEIFIKHFAEVGKHLRHSVEVYNEAVGSFDRRLVPAVRRLQEMGVSAQEVTSPDAIDVRPTLPESTERQAD